MGSVYDNPQSFGYLPPVLQNEFIKAGHNLYGKVRKAIAGGDAAAAAAHPIAAARVFKKAAVTSAKTSGGDVKAVKKAASQGVRKTIFNQKVSQGKKLFKGQPKMTKESGGGMPTPGGGPANPGAVSGTKSTPVAAKAKPKVWSSGKTKNKSWAGYK